MPHRNLLTTYLRNNLFRSFGAGLLLLTLLFAINHLLRLFGRAAIGELPESFIPILLLLLTFDSVTVFLPLVFLGSILWLFYRLQRRQELLALCSMGVAPSRYASALGQFAAVVLLLVALLSIWLSPLAKSYFFQQLQQAKIEAQLSQVIKSGQFLILPQEKVVLYAEEVEEKTLHKVFLLYDGRFLELAEQAYQDANDPTLLWLRSGRAYDLQEQRLLTFARQSLPLPTLENPRIRADSLPFLRLFQTASPKLQAEAQWRLAFPLSIIFLTLFAFYLISGLLHRLPVLSLLFGLMGYFVYANALSIGKVLLSEEKIPSAWGLWPVHFLALLLLLLLWLWRRGNARLVS